MPGRTDGARSSRPESASSVNLLLVGAASRIRGSGPIFVDAGSGRGGGRGGAGGGRGGARAGKGPRAAASSELGPSVKATAVRPPDDASEGPTPRLEASAGGRKPGVRGPDHAPDRREPGSGLLSRRGEAEA